jgi:hypothetical protein
MYAYTFVLIFTLNPSTEFLLGDDLARIFYDHCIHLESTSTSYPMPTVSSVEYLKAALVV